MSIKKIIKARKTARCANRTTFNCNMDEIAEKVVEYHKVKAELEKAHQEVDDRYAGQLAELEAEIYDLRDASEEYFLEHQEELCKPGLREGETTLAKFGIRLGNPTVAKTVKTAFKALAAKFMESEILCRWVRSTPELDKDAILATFRDKDATKDQNALMRAGITVEQKDEFWVKAKAEEQC